MRPVSRPTLPRLRRVSRFEIAKTNERIAQVEVSLKVEIAKTNERIAQVETRLVKWVVGTGIAIVAVISTLLVKLL